MTSSWDEKVAELGRGIVVGLVATTALDWLSMLLFDAESPADRRAENRARSGRFPYEVAIERLTTAVGHKLSDEAIADWGWRFHKTFGILGGLGYSGLRRAFPRVRWGLGLGFGAAFFLIVDEIVTPLHQLSPGPLAFSWKVHARGAAAHVAYGVAAETTARLLDPASSR
jgi:hypothetical protein